MGLHLHLEFLTLDQFLRLLTGYLAQLFCHLTDLLLVDFHFLLHHLAFDLRARYVLDLSLSHRHHALVSAFLLLKIVQAARLSRNELGCFILLFRQKLIRVHKPFDLSIILGFEDLNL